MRPVDRVLVELIIAAPIDRVWNALRDREQIRQWFGWDFPGADAHYDWVAAAPASTHGDVREINHDPDRYVVEPYDEGRTIVRVIRSAPATDKSWTGIYDDVFEGWMTFTQQLRFLVERAPKLARRTLYLNGRARAAGDSTPLEALGLGALATTGIGDRYAIQTATGETLNGEVWYRSIYQLGLTVKEFGDGLLIANTRPTTAKSPHGGGTLMLVTYGLSDAALADLFVRWPAWWKQTFDVIEIQPAS
jgi:hypothetical protein